MGEKLIVEWEGLHLVSKANKRECPMARSARARKHRQGFLLRLANKLRQNRPEPPWNVKITRMGPKALDTDNLADSAKSIRDGVADALGVDDGDNEKIGFEYSQQKTSGYGVRVEITSR